MLQGRRSNRMGVWMFCLLMPVSGLAGAASVELISKVDPVADSFGTNEQPVLSADGRYVAFLSNAANLVPGQEDDNDARDVFLHDRVLGTTVLVSHAAGAPTRAASSGHYDSLGISDDGRYVAFSSSSADLAPGAADSGNNSDVFLWDRVTGTTTLVSHAAGSPGTASDGVSSGVRISADGNFLTFISSSSNLVAGQAEPAAAQRTRDVFLWNRTSDTAILVSRKSGTTATAANQLSIAATLSADGGVVVFTTLASDLVPAVADNNENFDVYAYQRSTDSLSLISRVGVAPQSAAGALHEALAVSDDGRYVAFASGAGNLVPGQVAGSVNQDVFLYDRTTGEMRLVSRRSASPLQGGGVFDPSRLSMSGDGRYVAFSSTAPDLVPGQVDPPVPYESLDVFVYDRVTGLTALVSHSHESVTTAGSPGTLSAAAASGAPSLSADGRFLVFHSTAVDLVPGQADAPGSADVFLYDQASRSVTLVSHIRTSDSTAGNGQSIDPVLSKDGSVAAFLGRATDLGEGQTDPYNFQDLFLYHRTSGEITNPSRRDPGLPPLTSVNPSTLGGLSADGQAVVFQTFGDVFLRDTVVDTPPILISPPPSAPYNSEFSQDPVLSADGRFAAFLSILTPAPNPGSVEGIYLYDRTTGSRTLVNHAPGSPQQVDGFPSTFSLSADARYVAYQCSKCGLVPGHTVTNTTPVGTFQEVFLYDRLSGLNILVSHAASSPTAQANGESYRPAISANGRYVVFWSFATDLFPGQIDAPGTQDLFVFDRETGVTALVTHLPGSPATAAGLNSVTSPLIPVDVSEDGRFIAFQSTLANLVPGQVDANESADLFLYDLMTRTMVLVSHAASSPVTGGNGPSTLLEIEEDTVSMSADGRFLAYESLATDLVAGAEDTNSAKDVFLYDRLTGASSLVSHAGGAPLKAGNGASEIPRISADGSHVAFLSTAADITPGQTVSAGWYHLYVQERNPAGTAGTTAFIGRAFKTPRPFNPFPGDFVDEPSSFAPQISANGRRIAFHSEAAHVQGDYNGTWDVYLWDRGETDPEDPEDPEEPEEPEGPVTVSPCRLLDTRRRAERPILTSNVQRTVTAHGRCGVPATATEVLVKVTVFNPSGKGNLRFYPGPVTAAPSGILRFEPRATRTETFTLPLSTNGTLTILPFVRGGGTVHVAVEVNAYSE